MLAMQTALMGAFLAKDAFLFYFFFEASLLPIYFLAAIYGGENKNAITFKFFVYTLFGSLFFLIALVYVYLLTPGEFHSADIEVLYQTAKGLSADQQGYLFAAFFLAFAIKMPVFPFHTWQPDTYTVAPAQGTMLLSGIMLKMGIFGVLQNVAEGIGKFLGFVFDKLTGWIRAIAALFEKIPKKRIRSFNGTEGSLASCNTLPLKLNQLKSRGM